MLAATDGTIRSCLHSQDAASRNLSGRILEEFRIAARVAGRRIGEFRHEAVAFILEEHTVPNVVADDVGIGQSGCPAFAEFADAQNASTVAAGDQMAIARGENSVQARLRPLLGRIPAITLIPLFRAAAGERDILPSQDDGRVAGPRPSVWASRALRRIAGVPAIGAIDLTDGDGAP